MLMPKKEAYHRDYRRVKNHKTSPAQGSRSTDTNLLRGSFEVGWEKHTMHTIPAID